MRRAGRATRAWRRVLPWLVAWLAAQVVLLVGGRLLARRLDEGDENSATIRRVRLAGGLQLRAAHPVERVHLDVVMGGAELDLTGMGRPDHPVEVTAHVLMGGAAVLVPQDWRVWWSARGVGGVGADHSLQRTHDEHEADLRLRVRVVFGGVGVQQPRG